MPQCRVFKSTTHDLRNMAAPFKIIQKRPERFFLSGSQSSRIQVMKEFDVKSASSRNRVEKEAFLRIPISPFPRTNHNHATPTRISWDSYDSYVSNDSWEIFDASQTNWLDRDVCQFGRHGETVGEHGASSRSSSSSQSAPGVPCHASETERSWSRTLEGTGVFVPNIFQTMVQGCFGIPLLSHPPLYIPYQMVIPPLAKEHFLHIYSYDVICFILNLSRRGANKRTVWQKKTIA